MSSGRQRHTHSLLFLLLASLSLLASSCRSATLDDDAAAAPAVQGPALIAYFTDS